MSSMIGNRGSTGGFGQRSSANVGGDRIPKGFSQGRTSNFTPEMMELFQSLFGHLGPDSFLSKIAGGDEEAFGQMETPALKQFSGQLGNLASRFSGMGMGARNSSGFQNTATSAASDFAEKLQANRMGIQRDALKDLFGLSQGLLSQRPYENFLVPKEKGFWEQLFGGLSGGIGQGFGNKLGGLFG